MDRRKDLGRISGPVQVDEHVARAALVTVAANATDIADYALQVQSLGLTDYLPAKLRGLVETYEVIIEKEDETSETA